MGALALLAARHRSRRRRSTAPAAIALGNRFFRCLGRHGSVNMRRAIAKSCNTYFYAMGHRIGYDAIAPMAKQLGLGQKFDLPVVSQSFGTVPDSEWKLRRYNDNQAADRAARLDRVGHAQRLDRPGLSDPQSAPAGGDGGAHRLGPQRPAAADRRAHASPRRCSAFRPEHLEAVRGGMWEVVNGDGTAGRQPAHASRASRWAARPAPRRCADHRQASAASAGDWKYRDHGLFVCFAPTANPRYAGVGGDRAWPRRRARRGAGRQGRADLSVRPRPGAATPRRARGQLGRHARRAHRAPRQPRSRPPPRPAAARMISSAIIPQPLARLPWRLIFLVTAICRLRADHALFGGGRIDPAVGAQAGRSRSCSSCASRSACRGSKESTIKQLTFPAYA